MAVSYTHLWLAEKLGDFLEPEVSQNLSEIIDSVRATKASEFEITFDPTLVRGMSYYKMCIRDRVYQHYDPQKNCLYYDIDCGCSYRTVRANARLACLCAETGAIYYL